MIVKPMVPRGLPRKDSINPLSKKTKSRNPHLLQGEVVQLIYFEKKKNWS